MLVSSFKPNAVIFQDLRSLNAFVPTTFTLDNYRGVFERSNSGLFMFNSVFIVTGDGVRWASFVNSMAAYTLARLKWRGRKLLLAVIIAADHIPFETIAVPLLFVVDGAGLARIWQGGLSLGIRG